ncbi:MAG: hypothetical protein QME40_04790 [bacterium]|nr:hypothetical protein [bacterium]
MTYFLRYSTIIKMCECQGVKLIIFSVAISGFIFALPISNVDCALRIIPKITLREEYTDNFDLKGKGGFITYLYPEISFWFLGKTYLEFGYTLKYSHYSIDDIEDEVSHFITCLADRKLTRRLSIDARGTLFEPVEPVTIDEYGMFKREEKYYTSNKADLVLRYLVAKNIVGNLKYYYRFLNYKETSLSDLDRQEIGLDLAGRLSSTTTLSLEYAYERRNYLSPLDLLSIGHTVDLRLDHLLTYRIKAIFDVGYAYRKDEREPSIEDELYGVTLIYKGSRRDIGTINYDFRLMEDYEGSSYRDQRIRFRIERLMTRASSLSVGSYYGYITYVRSRRNDKLWGLGIRMGWQPHEDILFNFRYGWEERDSSESGKDYVVNRCSIEIRYTFW